MHIAAVSGKARHETLPERPAHRHQSLRGNFRSIGNNENNYLGRSNWGSDEYFNGQMDEVRVWVTARSQEQIRANMFARLTGREAGLAGLWNFDGDDAKDATPNALDGELRNDATTALAEVPHSPAELDLPTVLSGNVTDADGQTGEQGERGNQAGHHDSRKRQLGHRRRVTG